MCQCDLFRQKTKCGNQGVLSELVHYRMDTVHVEGFGSSLKGRTIWIVGDEHLIPNRLHLVEQELLGRGRRVLVLADGRKQIPRWAATLEWDAVFKVRDALDLRLCLTYITNATKPVRVIWIGEEPTPAVLSKLHTPDSTFLGYGTSKPQQQWDCIFFSGSVDKQKVEDVLMPRMGSAKLSQFNLGSVLPELRAVKAGLVWSSIGESDRSGHLYWYDIAEGEPPAEPFDSREAASFLRELADRIASAK